MPIYFWIAAVTIENHALRTIYTSLIPTFMATSYNQKYTFISFSEKSIHFVS